MNLITVAHRECVAVENVMKYMYKHNMHKLTVICGHAIPEISQLLGSDTCTPISNSLLPGTVNRVRDKVPIF